MRVLTAPRSFPSPLSLPPNSYRFHQKPPFLQNPSKCRPKPAILFKSASDPISPAPPEIEIESGSEPEIAFEPEFVFEDDFEIEVEQAAGKKNRRVIRSRIRVEADIETVWSVLTDYEGLADFIPSLVVCQLIEKGEKFAKLYQVGRQDLALGLTFDAKGVLECYERDIEYLPSGRRRDIEFKMVEGDFKMFEGKWSIEQIDNNTCKGGEYVVGQEFQTTLSYFVELEPKLWLPIRLLEGRLCKEVKNNLLCVREEAQRIQKLVADTLATTGESGENDAV